MSFWKPRLVALDVDGTLLNPGTQTISEPVRNAVRAVVDAGAHVVVSTGRSMLGTTPILEDLGVTSGTALCSNGAVTMDVATSTPVAVETFDPAPVYRALAERLPGAAFATEELGTGNLVTEPFSPRSLHGPQRLVSLDELLGEPVPRMIASWVGRHPDAVAEAMDGISLPGCTYTLDHYEPWVTVVPSGVTKGSVLEKLRTELGIPESETFAAGDGDNDITMLEWAAHGVAMGQAPETVRAAADEVTGPVTEDGVVAALNRWFPVGPE